jgi:hypothetical protein
MAFSCLKMFKLTWNWIKTVQSTFVLYYIFIYTILFKFISR